MILNLFFENMNANLELVLLCIFFIAIYFFLLRRFNSLGLRMLVLCICLFGACSFWLYKDEQRLKKMIAEGEEYVSTVVGKSISPDGKKNQVDIAFTTKEGKLINTRSSEYISNEEWTRFETGKPLSIVYLPTLQQTYVQQSVMRFKGDKIYLYYFAGFWLVLGAILYLWLKKYKVGVDERGNEWLEKADGTVLLDERKSAVFRGAKRANILSKLVQTFGKS